MDTVAAIGTPFTRRGIRTLQSELKKPGSHAHAPDVHVPCFEQSLAQPDQEHDAVVKLPVVTRANCVFVCVRLCIYGLFVFVVCVCICVDVICGDVVYDNQCMPRNCCACTMIII